MLYCRKFSDNVNYYTCEWCIRLSRIFAHYNVPICCNCKNNCNPIVLSVVFGESKIEFNKKSEKLLKKITNIQILHWLEVNNCTCLMNSIQLLWVCSHTIKIIEYCLQKMQTLHGVTRLRSIAMSTTTYRHFDAITAEGDNRRLRTCKNLRLVFILIWWRFRTLPIRSCQEAIRYYFIIVTLWN